MFVENKIYTSGYMAMFSVLYRHQYCPTADKHQTILSEPPKYNLFYTSSSEIRPNKIHIMSTSIYSLAIKHTIYGPIQRDTSGPFSKKYENLVLKT